MKYTIQNIYTGKYISSLFGDSHNQFFQAKHVKDAYTWNDKIKALKVAVEIGRCQLIEV